VEITGVKHAAENMPVPFSPVKNVDTHRVCKKMVVKVHRVRVVVNPSEIS